MMRALIVGCGYLGRRVATRWMSAGHEVAALTRSEARGEELRSQGVSPIVGDVLDPASLGDLPECDVLLYAVGYDRSAGVDKQHVYVDGLRNVLDRMASHVGRLIYISSSSVYGQSNGEWVDEDSPAEPQSEGGRICLKAEEQLRSSPVWNEGRATILRLTGIYGPGRMLARVESLKSGEPLAGLPDAWLNLIHVDDSATVVTTIADHQKPGPLYLVTDDQPVTRGDYYRELARQVDAPPPTFDESQQPRHGLGRNKRCRNDRVKDALGIVWRYPTFAAGLTDVVASR